MDVAGIIFDIQRFSVHDGPGIRTTVFLKGCPLRCVWCQNPEGLDAGVRLWRFDNLCVRCGRCVAVCPVDALAVGGDGAPRVDHDVCVRCGACVDECGRNAMAMDGREWTAEDLVAELMKDRVFFAASGGGVTFSGGEPLRQAVFVAEAAKRLKAVGVATAIETCLDADWRAVEDALPFVDFFQVDIKLADSLRHTAATGRDNARILDNFRRLAASVPAERLRVRVPLVPGYTADMENLRGIAGIVAGIDPEIRLELLNFNPLAAAKYRRMADAKYGLTEAKSFSDDEMRTFRECVGDLVRTVE